jgi:transposase-like protein
VHDVEVVAKATRRRFTAAYKRKLLRAADACTQPGAIGVLLRREGLYSSHLTTWRAQRERGEFLGLAPKPKNPLMAKVAALEREVTRYKARTERAEALVALQKKVAELLGSALPQTGGTR